ncbi:pilus assembly protein [Panacagrimonas sp.]|uniref:pilus assembly protein n=1 Tax=Panacagrimonas sp. TaxID=2480088 RepID=UPI003B51BBA1
MQSVLRHLLITLLLAGSVMVSAAHADDIEIYTQAPDNSLRPPMTIIALDLNLLGICNSVLTPSSNPGNPEAPQLCLNLSNNALLGDVLGGVSNNPAQLLTNLLLGTGGNDRTRAQGLCNLYGILGVQSPVVQIPAVGFLLQPLLGGVSTLSCGTLNFLLGIPLLGSVVNGLLGGFVGQLVAGLVNPLLTTAVGQLPATVTGLLNTTLSGVLNLGQVGLVSLLESILNQLVNSRVAIVVSHADRASAGGAPGSACAFGEQASIPTTRRETPGCSNGAYFLVGFTPLVDQGSVTQLLTRVTDLLLDALQPANLLNSTTALLSTALTTPTQLLPPYQGKEIYAEIAHYLAGDAVYNAPLNRWDGLTGLLTRDPSIESGGQYLQPDAQCDTVNVLNVQLTNADRQDESDDTLRHYFPGAEENGEFAFERVVQEAQDEGFVDGNGNRIALRSHFVVQENLSSLNALTQLGINATTYANNLGLLNLGQTLAEFLQPVLQVDASLLTPSNTADLLQPGRVRAEAFFSGFRPELEQKPRWPGNLKKLEVRADDNGVFGYFDANGNPAIAGDGRIDTDALTYWTRPAQLGPNVADGRDTTLGGAGQNIPGHQLAGGGNPGRSNGGGARTLFYERHDNNGVAALAAMNADDSAVRDELRDALGAANDSEAHALLLYARGFEVGPTSAPLGTGSDLEGRDWMHGAVLHSRPVAINYGARAGYSDTNPDIRVIYGATDGWLRMVANTAAGGAQAGSESWAFMPRAVMDQQKRLRDNQPTARFPYGVDGAPTVVLRDRSPDGGPADGRIDANNSHDGAAVYFGLRRGGSHLYALDVKNPDTPRLLWRIGPDGLHNSSGLVPGSEVQFAEIALTFSNPQAGRIQYRDNGNTLTRSVIVFAGGYHGGRDGAGARIGKDLARGSDEELGGDDSRGNAVYMVDAATGELIWKARRGELGLVSPYDSATRTFQHPLLADSIAADTTVVDTNGDGLLDRLYAVDTGGRLWRADFAGVERSAWTLTALASVGRHDSASLTADRRFFHAPDYVPFRDANGAYDAVVFGSGDRADPFNTTAQNFLYVYRDRDVGSGKTLAQILASESELEKHADFVDLTAACASGAQDCGAVAEDAIGWKLRLGDRGEKTMSQPLTTGGTVYFTTYLTPDPDSRNCAPQEGRNRVYGVSLADSRPLVDRFINDADNDGRSSDGGAPGLAGEINTLATNTISANTQTLEARSPRYYPVYWRERRGDDETPP